MSKAASPPPPPPPGFEPSLEFKNFLKGKSPLSKNSMDIWNVSSVPSTLAPLPERQEIVTSSPPTPAMSLVPTQQQQQQMCIPNIVIDSDASSSASSSDTDNEEEEQEQDKELDTVENAMNPLIRLYVDNSAAAIVLCGNSLSEQVLHVNELMKKYNMKEMKAGVDKAKNLYADWLSDTTQCLEGMEDLKEINEKNLLAMVAAFSRRTNFVVAPPKTKKRKTKKPFLEKDISVATPPPPPKGIGFSVETPPPPKGMDLSAATKRKGKYKRKYKKDLYTATDREYMRNCQIEYRCWLLAGKDNHGNKFDMKDLVKIMSEKLKHSPSGIAQFLRTEQIRFGDNKDEVLISKMKQAKIHPWPKTNQIAIRTRMLKNALKHQKKKRKH